MADCVLPLDAVVPEILRQTGVKDRSRCTRSRTLHPDNYRFLQDYVYRESGIVLDGDKQYLLEARLMPIVHANAAGRLNDLCALLRAAGRCASSSRWSRP